MSDIVEDMTDGSKPVIELPPVPKWIAENMHMILIGCGVTFVAGTVYWLTTPEGQDFIDAKLSWIKGSGKTK